ncbi:hypothetical protein VNO77_44211 [Canavalia gladiata]|uniref:Uncharacterized protein n=1 Tax=Canavalia gladiata TaxID=3824 RepID=A0AAN9JXT0_CANGL
MFELYSQRHSSNDHVAYHFTTIFQKESSSSRLNLWKPNQFIESERPKLCSLLVASCTPHTFPSRLYKNPPPVELSYGQRHLPLFPMIGYLGVFHHRKSENFREDEMQEAFSCRGLAGNQNSPPYALLEDSCKVIPKIFEAKDHSPSRV